jgi:hypothetical protein
MNEQNREIVLYAEDELQLWHERRPGFSIFGSYTGRVVLTSARLLFLSTGGSGVERRLALGTLGVVGTLLFGQTSTAELDLSALSAEGSLAVPLGRITQGSAQRRCDCTNYVGIQYAKEGAKVEEGEELAECAFMPKDGIAWPGAAAWASKLDEARAAFASSPYR